MIDIPKLSEKEYGRISSWNENFIFVAYNGKWQSQAARPGNLTFAGGENNV